MKTDKRTMKRTVADALTFVAATNGPAKDDLRSKLQAPQMGAAFTRYPKGYIIIEYNEDNLDMGKMVQRLIFHDGMRERRLATSEKNSWRFEYPG